MYHQPVNPLILAVDTTREIGSLALVRGDQMLEIVEMHAPTGFAHVLYGHLSALLDRHALQPHAVDAFAAASGPGSFTGVRVGLACIKGLAEACAKPAIAVSNLQALAAFGTSPVRAVVIDARRGDIYGAVYDAAGCTLLPEVVMKCEAWLQTLPAGEIEFITLDCTPPLAETRFRESPVITAPKAIAGAIAKIALARFRQGEAADPAALDANYVRRSDAELFWKEQ